MKEKIQEFDIEIKFRFDSNMTIEALNEKEALKIAQKHYMEIIRDHLRDKDNLNIKVKSKHTITAEERTKLENDGIIEPRKLTKAQQAKLEKEATKKAFFEQQQADVSKRKKEREEKEAKKKKNNALV